jgi:Protein of unknown function (DUF2786)
MERSAAEPEVLRRLQKLLAMARGVANQHEAALAAERAAELLARHQLSEAEIALEGPPPTRETIVDDELTRTRKRVRWQAVLAHGAARSLGCHAYWRGASIQILGRATAVQATAYTCRYLFAEVTRLCDEGFEAAVAEGLARGMARAWKHAFRVGAANSIAERLEEQAEARRAPVSASRALVHVAQDQAEVDAAYEAALGGRRGRAARTSVSSFDGYEAGLEAGARVALGGAKAALGAGAPRLRSR